MSNLSPISALLSPLKKLSQTFPAMRHANYRKWFLGASVSVVGSWMTGVTLAWVVWQQTQNPFYLGLLGLCFQVPMAIIILPAGILLDRADRRRLIFITQAALMISSAALTVFSWMGLLSIPLILLLAVIRGFIQGFDMPARQTFVLDMVDRDTLPSAIAMNSAVFNTGRIAGPAVAGILIASAGVTFCFAIDALTFIPLLFALAAMRLPPTSNHAHPTRQIAKLHDLKLGVLVAISDPRVSLRLILLALTGVFLFSYGTLLPVFADQVFGGGPKTLGLLTSAVGVGAVTGALIVSAWCRKQHQALWMFLGVLLGAIALAALAVVGNIYLGMACMVVLGLSQLMHNSPSNSGVQLAAPDRYRGRLTSLWSLIFISTMPLGALFASSLATAFSPRYAVAIGAAFSLVAALTAGLRLLATEPSRKSLQQDA